ncbi:MAG: HEAT repeat domain-containing protein [Gemmatimonadetes bacterium]|nr:HEAT repeat domain-containing protein [Gemmatimonadota bacterium]
MSEAPRPAERPAPPQELLDLLLELASAVQKHTMYPEGHPALAPAGAAVAERIEKLLRERGSLALGVASRQLVIGGAPTDPQHPVLGGLAERLHRHQIGALSFEPGISADEAADLLRALAADADRAGPLGARPPERFPAWPHVHLFSVRYDSLELADGVEGGEEGGPVSRGTELWLGLARTALAAGAAQKTAAAADPATVARAINTHEASRAYEQAIVGYFLQIAEELKTGGISDAPVIRRRMARLITDLRPDTLRRLVNMGGDFGRRRSFVLDASHAFSLDAVMALLRAAAEASDRSLSHTMVRLLSKMAQYAEGGSPQVRSQADTALREQVRHVLQGWDGGETLPEPYTRVLGTLARSAQGSPLSDLWAEPLEVERIIELGLELDVNGPDVWTAVDRSLEEGKLGTLAALLDRAPAGSHCAQEIWRRIATAERLAVVLAADPVDLHLVDKFVAHLGAAAAAPLLRTLVESESRRTRRELFERLGAFGSAIVPLAAELLADERWFVQRNLLSLLNAVGEWPEGVPTAPYAGHPDARVRREAFRLLLRLDGHREDVLAPALQDADPAILRRGLAAAQEMQCPPVAVPIVASRALDADLPMDLRALGVRVLGRVRSPEVLETLLRLASRPKRLFLKPRVAASSPVTLAALASLAAGWSDEPRAAALLARARRARDLGIRAAAREIEPQP